ncbi:MAG: SPOR domain-containing protein [Steroidobacteraceae bacterium]
MNTRLLIPALVCAAVALSACNLMADSDWHKATLANTIASYQTFLQEHPHNKQADNARGRILALRDEHAWSAALATNTITGYDGYLKAWSGGVHVSDVPYQITALQRAAAWKTLQNDPSAASLQAFLGVYPQGRESNEARAKLKDFYHLQLADSRSAAAAERKRAELQRRFALELSGIAVVAPSAPATLYHVISGPMSQAAATSTCATLERAHQSCKSVQGVNAGSPPASLSAN